MNKANDGKKYLTSADSLLGKRWEAINWLQVEKEVKRLQMRIAKAVREDKWNKVKALQWLLTHSLSANELSGAGEIALYRCLSRVQVNWLARF